MKWFFYLLSIGLFISLHSSMVDYCYGQVASDADVNVNIIQSEQSNYFLGRYLVSSGSIMGAVSPHHIHWATVGEPLLGDGQNMNHILIAGFWKPQMIWTGVAATDNVTTPSTFALYQNYPNPFNPQTVISYDLPVQCHVLVEIFNIHGQRIRLLASERQSPGWKSIIWDGRDNTGKLAGTGVYLYHLTAQTESGVDVLFQATKKMLFIK